MELVPLLVLMAAFAVVASVVARRKGRRMWVWALFGALLSPIALVAIAFLPGARSRIAGVRADVDAADPDAWQHTQSELRSVKQKREEVIADARRHLPPRFWGGRSGGL